MRATYILADAGNRRNGMTEHERPNKATYAYAHTAYLEELELRIKAQFRVLELEEALRAWLEAAERADFWEMPDAFALIAQARAALTRGGIGAEQCDGIR